MIFTSRNPALLKFVTRVIGIFSILFAIVMLAIMCYQGVQTAIFIHQATTTKGTILGQPPDEDANGNPAQDIHPKVLFTTNEGKVEVFISPHSVSVTQYGPGDSVAVLYDPHNPQNARIGGVWSLWQDTLGYLLGSIIFLISGCAFYFAGTYLLPQLFPQQNPITRRQRMGNPLAFLIASVISLLSFIGCGVTSYYLYSNTRNFLHQATHTQGTVIAFQASNSQDNSTTYSPQITFKDANGRSTTFTSNISSSSPQYSVGDNVDVVYDPANPSNAKVNAFYNLWLMPLACFVCSIISLIFSAGFALASRNLF